MTNSPTPHQTTETDRQYIDRLKREYIDALAAKEDGGCFVWANLFNPNAEQRERHKRLVCQAELELGVTE